MQYVPFTGMNGDNIRGFPMSRDVQLNRFFLDHQYYIFNLNVFCVKFQLENMSAGLAKMTHVYGDSRGHMPFLLCTVIIL